jgi:undecaprenyl-diphosphatase
MSLFQALILAFIQGLTEFLPLSSSGHLVLFQHFFNLENPPVFFDVLLHLGTLGAILIFFRQDILFLFKEFRRETKLWFLLVIASLPAGLFGYYLNSQIGKIFGNLKLVGFMWLITGVLLFLTKFSKSQKIKKTNLREIKISDGLFIGFFQALALFPGLSRSGSTVSAGLFRKLSPELAFKFSFLLSIPAVLGANLLQIKEISLIGLNFKIAFFPLLVAGLTGYLTLILLKKILICQKFYYFGFYCFILGTLVLFLF